ncbi:MAG: hypothetical protein M0C28_18695 [Candidatus Moduliflexus flocculans]|nr:hypothetical protein [Candidatus Moduliflexus flocculans]
MHCLIIILSFLGIIFLGSILFSASDRGERRAPSLSRRALPVDLRHLRGRTFSDRRLGRHAVRIRQGRFGTLHPDRRPRHRHHGDLRPRAPRRPHRRDGTLVVREALNQSSLRGIVRLVKAIVLTSLAFEGDRHVAVVHRLHRDYPFWQALGISAFHAVSAFNNAGFDLLGATSLIPYADSVLLNLTTAFLDHLRRHRLHRHLRHHAQAHTGSSSRYSKIVIKTTAVLLVAGTLILKLTEGAELTVDAGVLPKLHGPHRGILDRRHARVSVSRIAILMLLMFIGASPASSTGGGIKDGSRVRDRRIDPGVSAGKNPITKSTSDRRRPGSSRSRSPSSPSSLVFVAFHYVEAFQARRHPVRSERDQRALRGRLRLRHGRPLAVVTHTWRPDRRS